MKTCKSFLIALFLFLTPLPIVTADSGSEVTPGETTQPTSEAPWWDIPYPDRFDSSRLTREQTPISTDGNHFVGNDGQIFIFRGVNIADPDKLVFQQRWNRQLFEEIDRWGANTIRLPIHPIAWRKRGKDWYFDRIDEATTWANDLGMYLIIDWHSIGNLNSGLFQHPMYETTPVETAEFWRSIAHRYKDVPTVAVYELFNEPTDNFIGTGKGSLGKLTWEQWRDSLESLIDLVRVYDPDVITLVSGLNWAYDLGPVADMPVRRENVAYAAHAYPQKAKPDENTREAFFQLWQIQWGFVADTYPIIASEIGWVREDGFNAHVPVINNDGSYGPNLINFMENKGISWTVWNFDADWAPVMINGWDFTPSEQGRFYRDVMLRARDDTLQPSVIPSPRVTEYPWMSIARWQALHSEDVLIAEQGDIDLLFLGDSITEGWPDSLWLDQFGDRNAANFGIGGDKTQNLLWRLQNGSAGKLDPKVVVMMIGVNNFGLGEAMPQDVFMGVDAALEESKAAFPNARIILLGILPYGEQARTPVRQNVTETNALLAGLGDDPRVEFHDIGAAFIQSDGAISPQIMADFLHPTEKGYAIFARELQQILQATPEPE